PVVLAFVVSLFRWDLLGTRSFLGLENYRSLLADGALANSLLVTGIFTLISVPVSLAIGLVLATQLVRALPGSAVVRVIVLLPWCSRSWSRCSAGTCWARAASWAWRTTAPCSPTALWRIRCWSPGSSP